jgi:AcrR family transcriptional regulator
MGPVRRAQIVRATVQCLAREGYTRLTMKKVARAAGVSQGILHYYFRDKRAILIATLETVSRDLDRRVAAAQSRTGRDAAARLRALVRACLEVAVARPEFWVVFVEFWGEMMHDRRLREVNAEVYTRTRRLIGRLVAEGVAAGRFRAVDPQRAAAIVLGLVDGISLQLTFDPEAFTVAEATRFCDDALGRYLGKERA